MDFNKIKSIIINTIIGILVLGVVSLIPFYYITRETLAQHSKEIKNTIKEVKELEGTIRDNEQAPIVIKGEINVIKNDIDNIKQNQQEMKENMKEDLSKIFILLKEIKSNNHN